MSASALPMEAVVGEREAVRVVVVGGGGGTGGGGGLTSTQTRDAVRDGVNLAVKDSTVTFDSVTVAGSISANTVSRVSFSNVGTAAGTLMTKSLPAGASVTFQASRGGKITNAIAYDARGTQFLIASEVIA